MRRGVLTEIRQMITSASSVARFHEIAPAPSPTPTATGYESPRDAADAGWLGQTPPPSVQTRRPCAETDPVRYAVAELAPEPWKDSGSLWGNDPTLFG